MWQGSDCFSLSPSCILSHHLMLDHGHYHPSMTMDNSTAWLDCLGMHHGCHYLSKWRPYLQSLDHWLIGDCYLLSLHWMHSRLPITATASVFKLKLFIGNTWSSCEPTECMWPFMVSFLSPYLTLPSGWTVVSCPVLRPYSVRLNAHPRCNRRLQLITS